MSHSPLVAATILEASWVSEHEERCKIIHDQLIRLNTIVFIIKKIGEFPFYLFNNEENYVFWGTVRRSLAETAIMIISRVIVDPGSDVITLRKLKNLLLKHCVDDEAKAILLKYLKKVSFEKRIKEIEINVKAIRDTLIAHLVEDKLIKPQAPSGVTYNDIEQILNAAFDLFNVLSLSVYYVPWYYGHRDEKRNSQTTDIDLLLDKVAKDSYLLNLPEKYPDAWSDRRLSLSDSEINKINYYRKRAGLSEVS